MKPKITKDGQPLSIKIDTNQPLVGKGIKSGDIGLIQSSPLKNEDTVVGKVELELDQLVELDIDVEGIEPTRSPCNHDPTVSLEELALASPHGGVKVSHGFDQPTATVVTALASPSDTTKAKHIPPKTPTPADINTWALAPNPECDLSSPMQLPEHCRPSISRREETSPSFEAETQQATVITTITTSSSQQRSRCFSSQHSGKKKEKRHAKHGGIYSLLLRNAKKAQGASSTNGAHEVGLDNETRGIEPVEVATSSARTGPAKPRHGGIYKSLIKKH